MIGHAKHETEKSAVTHHPYNSPEPKPAPVKLYVLWQALTTSRTLTRYGAYSDRKGAEGAAADARGGPDNLQHHKTARYFVQEVEAEEVAKLEATRP